MIKKVLRMLLPSISNIGKNYRAIVDSLAPSIQRAKDFIDRARLGSLPSRASDSEIRRWFEQINSRRIINTTLAQQRRAVIALTRTVPSLSIKWLQELVTVYFPGVTIRQVQQTANGGRLLRAGVGRAGIDFAGREVPYIPDYSSPYYYIVAGEVNSPFAELALKALLARIMPALFTPIYDIVVEVQSPVADTGIAQTGIMQCGFEQEADKTSTLVYYWANAGIAQAGAMQAGAEKGI